VPRVEIAILRGKVKAISGKQKIKGPYLAHRRFIAIRRKAYNSLKPKIKSGLW
jgi:hypothetical protein